MKKLYLLWVLILLCANSFAQTSLVGSKNYDRIGKTRDGQNFDYQKVFPPCLTENVISSIPFQGYEKETKAYKGLGEVTYYFKSANPEVGCTSNSKTNLTKPIIVLDGFDPGDSRSGAEIYGKYLSYIENINQTGIEQLLGHRLRDVNTPKNGYDIIILNFPRFLNEDYVQSSNPKIDEDRQNKTRVDGGSDYIERNAMVLVELINRVNAQLQTNGSTEKLTIIGPSMGGLISRYALAYMEKNGINHNTKLWISFDSPHLGANIPIGDQWYLDYMATFSPGAGDARDEQIGSSAARQMLLHHHLSNSQAVAGAPNYRDRFKRALEEENGIAGSKGFPVAAGLRRVALINGSQNSVTQPGSACGTAFNFETYLGHKASLFFLRRQKLIGAAITKANVYFSPQSGSTCKVFEGIGGQVILTPLNTVKYAQALNSGKSLDLSPGGTYDSQAIIKESGLEAQNAYTGVSFKNLVANHSFIPTKSALAFRWNDQQNIGDLGEDLSNRDLVCSRETPFHTYFAPAKNEEHVFLTAESVAFVENEIKDTPQLPTTNPPAITGPAIVELNNQATFSVSPVLDGTSFTWTVPTGWRINGQAVTTLTITGSTGSSVTLSPTSTAQAGQVCVTVNSTCPSYNGKVACKAISSQIPPLAVTINGPREIAGYTNQFEWTATASGGTGTQTYAWYVNTGSGYGSVVSTSSSYRTTIYNYTQVRVVVTSGTKTASADSYAVPRSGSSSMTIAPNPAADEFTVFMEEEPTKSDQSVTAFRQSATEVNVKLLNSQNLILRQGKMQGGKVTFAVGNLPNGLYYLHVQTGSEVIRKLVEIWH